MSTLRSWERRLADGLQMVDPRPATLVTFPRLTLRDALAAHLKALGQLNTETLRYPNAPGIDTTEPLEAAVAAAEEEREALLAALGAAWKAVAS